MRNEMRIKFVSAKCNMGNVGEMRDKQDKQSSKETVLLEKRGYSENEIGDKAL